MCLYVRDLIISLCFLVANVVPSQYFKRKRGIAIGIVYAGGGVGGAIISFMLTGLLERLGIVWTYRVLGLLTIATGLPAAWFVKERRAAGYISNVLVEW